MRRSPLILIASAALALAGCSGDDEEPADPVAGLAEDELAQDEEDATEPLVPVESSTDLVDPGGSVVGTASFRDDDGRAIVELQVAGLTPGFHPLYLYGAGTCDLDAAATGDGAFLELPALLVLEEGGVGSMTTLAGSMSLDELLADDGTALLIAPAVETLADVPPVIEGERPFGSSVACGAVEG